MSTVRAVLRHPLFITAATLAATVVFADRIAQVSGDRQRELEVKQRLLTEVADSSTRAVATAGAAAESAVHVARRKELYSRLSREWVVDWSRVGSQLQVYFDAETVRGEWNAFDARLDDYLRVAVLRPQSRAAEVRSLRTELTDAAFLSDANARDIAQRVDWNCIETPTGSCFFLDDLALAGQLLLLRRAELDRRILDEPATGFAHRVFPPW